MSWSRSIKGYLARWLPAGVAKRLGACAWAERSPSSPRQLRAADLCLWAQSGHRCWLGELVPASTEWLRPEFTLLCPPDHPQATGEGLLSWSLLQGAGRVPLARQTVSLGGGSLRVRGPAIALRNSRLLAHPGRYCLLAASGTHEVARFDFRLLSEPELGQAAKITRLTIDAQKHDGTVVPGLKVLRWQQHVAVLPSFSIQSPIPAPNTLVHCVAQILQGAVVLSSEDFLLPLEGPARQVRLRRLELNRTALGGRSKPTRFSLAVYIAGELKALTPFLLLPADQIANAEGQLIQDAKDLPLDDLEYDQILNGLALPLPPPVSRKLWR